MNEEIIGFLWKSQYFDQQNLQTDAGESLQILALGQQNTNAGPDFTNVRVLIDGLEWAGHVELHVRSSDWQRHNHTQNRAYDSVVLHVVYENDTPVVRTDGTLLPTLTLKKRILPHFTQKYYALIESQTPVPCAAQFDQVPQLTKVAMLDRALMQRLERKAVFVQELLAQNKQDWEETTYQLLGHNFGFKLNSEPFLRLAQGLPFKILQKHRNNLQQIEALLLGQAGWLQDPDLADEYTVQLKREHQFLAAKYNLETTQLRAHQWHMLRLRPANFPVVRLAQLAALVQAQPSLFSLLLNTTNLSDLSKQLRVKQSVYWQNHYLIGKEAQGKVPALGRSSVENIVINTVVPLLVAYSQAKDNRQWLDQAVTLLEQLPAEHNHITNTWQQLGLATTTSFDSQAAIELYNQFCTHRKCLQCGIGASLVRG
jgi:Protein of unknown function (DUF2851)